MILPDTSAWIEFYRATGSATHLSLRRLIDDEGDLVVTDMVLAEVLSGARDDAQWRSLREQLLGYPLLPLGGLRGFEHAAEIYRECRRQGVTPRSITDCLVAAPAREHDAELLHADRDLDAIARCVGIRVFTPPAAPNE